MPNINWPSIKKNILANQLTNWPIQSIHSCGNIFLLTHWMNAVCNKQTNKNAKHHLYPSSSKRAQPPPSKKGMCYIVVHCVLIDCPSCLVCLFGQQQQQVAIHPFRHHHLAWMMMAVYHNLFNKDGHPFFFYFQTKQTNNTDIIQFQSWKKFSF